MKKNILGIICVILVIAFANSCGNSTRVGSNANDSTAIADSLDSVIKKGWVYRSSVDEMDGSTSKMAIIYSSNVVEFDPPYEGGSKLHIAVLNSKENGTNVGIVISNGQFSVSELDGTNYVRIRFDEDAPITFSTISPLDGSFDTLFLENPKKFIKLAKNAKTIKVEATFFTEGSNIFTFNTEKPLDL